MSDSKLLSRHSHWRAILLALLVTFLWSTSWVLIKIGLKASLPAITFAGLRYSLAFVCLLPPVLMNSRHRDTIKQLSGRMWIQLMGLGLVFYTLTQGAQFLGLALLPATTLTLLLNFTPVMVALSSGVLNHESPSHRQWIGILLSICGAVIYFLPLHIPAGQTIGLLVALIGILANSGSALMGRSINLHSGLSPLIVTTISMGIGGLILLVSGAAIQGFGRLDPVQWAIIAWLAVVNTAIAFTLWNYTLRTLTAVESSIINCTMLPQIALLAWLCLDEPLNPHQIGGIVLVAAGTLLVQLRRRPKT